MTELEQRDLAGVVNLRAVGMRGGIPTTFSFRADGTYKTADGILSRTPAQLRSEAAAGTLLTTLTAAPRSGMGDPATPQPLLGVTTTGAGPTGDPDLPLLPGDNPMTLRGVDVLASAPILVDGSPVAGSVSCVGGSFTPFCSSQTVSISLSVVPGNGLHLLQVQNPNGPLSNEVPICVGSVASCQQP
jgi:hypothetical protein